jgi:hypothetical protein
MTREAELEAALSEMVEAHSKDNIGINAFNRRLNAIKKAKALLAKEKTKS